MPGVRGGELRTWPDDFVNKIIHGDCIEVMKTLEPNSIDLIIADPQYNIKKARWDRIPNYIAWMGDVFKAFERVLKKNGSLYFFHNHMPTVSKLMVAMEEETSFIFKQFIVWNKRFKTSKNFGYLTGYVVVNGLRNYKKMAEYILFYTFQDEAGLTTVMLDVNNFSTLRRYFMDYQKALGLTKKQILETIGQSADHCFRWGSSQWDIPTRETYEKINRLPVNNGFLRREYEDLRREYEDLRYTFNNQKSHHSVWEYDFVSKNGHETPKPIDLIKNIILHSSNEGDIILDPFLGSGTTAIAAIETNRRFIGIERDPEYVELAKKRIAHHTPAPQQMELRA